MERKESEHDRKKKVAEWLMQQTAEPTAEDIARGKALCLSPPNYDDIEEFVELVGVSEENEGVTDRSTESLKEEAMVQPNMTESVAIGTYDASIMARPTQLSLGFANQAGGPQLNVSGGGDQETQRISNEMTHLHVFDGNKFINERPPRRAFFPGGNAAAVRIVRDSGQNGDRKEADTSDPSTTVCRRLDIG